MSLKDTKLAFFSIILFFSFSAYSLPNLKCITSGLPTTSFLLTEKEDHVALTVIHHNGPKYAPVLSGVVTPEDINLIKKSGEFFSKLGERFTVKFSKENCELEENKFFRCSLREPSEIASVKIDQIYFNTSEAVEKIPGFEFVSTHVHASFRSNYEEFNLEMRYYDQDCKIISAK